MCWFGCTCMVWFANNKLAVMVAEVEVEVVESGRGHEDGCKTGY